MVKPHIPGALLSAFNAKEHKRKAAVPGKGEMGMVMKKKAAKRKHADDHDADDVSEKHAAKKKRKSSKRSKEACKTCGKVAGTHMKRKHAKKA